MGILLITGLVLCDPFVCCGGTPLCAAAFAILDEDPRVAMYIRRSSLLGAESTESVECTSGLRPLGKLLFPRLRAHQSLSVLQVYPCSGNKRCRRPTGGGSFAMSLWSKDPLYPLPLALRFGASRMVLGTQTPRRLVRHSTVKYCYICVGQRFVHQAPVQWTPFVARLHACGLCSPWLLY